MNSKHAAQAYQSSSLENAPPIKIVRLLYEGAIRFLDYAERGTPHATNPDFVRWLTRVEAIVAELRASLDHEPAPAVSKELDRLYDYVQHELARALLKRDAVALANARRVLATLLEGWKAVEVEAGSAAA